LILQRFSNRRSRSWATFLCIALLSIAGCTSPPLGASARKGPADETSIRASGPWYGDDDKDKSAGPARYHKVKPGESFSDVATLYGLTVADLLRSNHGLDPADGLKPGQLIYVPRQ
jgi:hypothetical protein